MGLYKKHKFNSLHLKGEDHFEGVSIEREMEQAMAENQPIQKTAIANVFYTRRKDGVLPETDIRTDRFNLAQLAMDKLNKESKQKVQELYETKAVDDTDNNSAEH